MVRKIWTPGAKCMKNILKGAIFKYVNVINQFLIANVWTACNETGMLLLGKSKGCDLYACSREPLFQNECSYNVQVNVERAILHCNVIVLILLLRRKHAALIKQLRILMFVNNILMLQRYLQMFFSAKKIQKKSFAVTLWGH